MALGIGILEFPKIVGERAVEEDKSIDKGQEIGIVYGTIIIVLGWEWTGDSNNTSSKGKLFSWNTTCIFTITLTVDLFRHNYPFLSKELPRETHSTHRLSNLSWL